MVYCEIDPDVLARHRNTPGPSRSRAEQSIQNPLLSPRLTGSYASQQVKSTLELDPLTQTVASSVSSADHDDSRDEVNISVGPDGIEDMSVYTQRVDETLTNDRDQSSHSLLDGHGLPSNHGLPNNQSEPPSHDHGKSSHSQQRARRTVSSNPTRTLPYIKPRPVHRYPADLPPVGGDSVARLMQQHLLYLLPCLEEAISDWNMATTEEGQAYWWDVVQSLQGRIDHACQVLSRFLPPPEDHQDPNLAGYISLVQEYWRRPTQEKVVIVNPPRPTGLRPQKDENIVVVDE
ncbi:hypothetical protein BGX27_010304 [Mortierella sp. AM989]|nr:hypothetical protein BGX27_010304 [Mortierella sp. AM989]